MDEAQRRLLRAFEAEPSEDLALELLARGVRADEPGCVEAAVSYLADLSRWDRLARPTRRELGALLEAFLPELRFERLEHVFLGEVSHEVLVFSREEDADWFAALREAGGRVASAPERTRLEASLAVSVLGRGWDDPFVSSEGWRTRPRSEWVLVPGGEVRLGWKGSLARAFRRWSPDAEEEAFEAWGSTLDGSIRPPTQVALRPFLCERQRPFLRGIHLLGPEDLADPPVGREVLRVIQANLAARGWRLPSVDEWEHACAAGGSSLFRWGDLWPTAPPEATTWDGYLVPNGFGLCYGDPWGGLGAELTATPGVLKGGPARAGAEDTFVYGQEWTTAITASQLPPLVPGAPLAEGSALALVRRVQDLVPAVAP